MTGFAVTLSIISLVISFVSLGLSYTSRPPAEQAPPEKG